MEYIQIMFIVLTFIGKQRYRKGRRKFVERIACFGSFVIKHVGELKEVFPTPSLVCDVVYGNVACRAFGLCFQLNSLYPVYQAPVDQ